MANGANTNYRITDTDKLLAVATRIGIATDGRGFPEIASDVADAAINCFGKQDEEPILFLEKFMPKKRFQHLKNLEQSLLESTGAVTGFLPRGIDREAVDILHRTHFGCDADPLSLIAQEPEIQQAAVAVGARRVNVVGLCCTGNEVLLRQGVGMAGNEAHSELAIMTGEVEAMVVDVQCIYPALADLAACFHTRFITTSEQTKIPGARHIQFHEDQADAISRTILKDAIAAFPRRNKARVHIPEHTATAIVGFTVEEILKVQQDSFHRQLTSELIKRNILVIGTGCWAIGAAKAGLMDLPAQELAGEGLKGVCRQLGIPPVLHMGSCVDCSRMLVLAGAITDHLDLDISQLPLVGSAPEWSTEKAVAIGAYFVGSGIPVHLWPLPPILGGPAVTRILT